MASESQNLSILKKIDTVEKLKDFLKKKKKSSKDHLNYDILFRHFITKDTSEDQLDNLLDIFLPKLDPNFQNKNNGNTTPLMHLVEEGLNSLCEQMIQKTGQNLILISKDDKQENIFFKIINSENDNGKVNLFESALRLLKEENEEDEKKEILAAINSEGKSLIECALNVGNSDITYKLLIEGIEPKIKNNITGDNLLHFAIRGKNPYCLTRIFNEVDPELIHEFINETNKENETPLQLAKKLNIVSMVKLLNDFISGEKKAKNSGDNNEDEIYDLLSQLNEDNTQKIVNSIKKNYYVSDWNKIFLEIIEKNKSNQKFDINLMKKIEEYFGFNKEKENNEDNKSNEENKEEIKFPICLNNKDKLNKLDEKDNIHFYNYIIGAEQSSDFSNILNAFKLLVQNYKSEDQSMNNYILYVNTIIILIEKSLKQNMLDFAEILIQNLSKYLQDYNIDSKSFDFKNSNSNQFLKYLSANEVINPTTDLKGLLLLYTCNLNLLKNDLEKAQENLVEFKSKFYGSDDKKNKNNEPIHKTMENMYHFLKVKVDYFLNAQFKMNKHLSIIEKNKSNNDNILFNYNFLGITNLKQGQYSYAEYCFKFCKNIINNNSMLYLKYLDGIEYNLSLCYYFTKNYEKAIQILEKIKNLETMKNNPYLFYRLGLCYIELEFEKEKKIFEKNNENDVINKTISDENCNEPAYKKRFILVNKCPSESINKDNNDKDAKKNEESVIKLDLNKAIITLKECILLLKGYNSYNKQVNDILKPLYDNNCDIIDLKSLFNKDKNDLNEVNNKQYKDIFASSYMNLIFCLIRNENYIEALEFIEEFKDNNESEAMKEYKFILDNYTIEVLLKLGNFEKALNILSQENFSYENIDEKGNFLSNSNNLVYDEVSYRLALYINLIKINILNNNFQEAEKYIASILKLVNYQTEKELPSYIINIIIFYFLSIGKNEEAVQVIKHRRIPKFYSN